MKIIKLVYTLLVRRGKARMALQEHCLTFNLSGDGDVFGSLFVGENDCAFGANLSDYHYL